MKSKSSLGNKKWVPGGADSLNVILVVDGEEDLPDGEAAPAVLHQEEDGQGEAEEEADEAEEGGDEGDLGGLLRPGDQRIALAQLGLASSW